ncbi:MAG TPA: glycosyltransferase family 4 protein, partial [Tepidisphaeraceae bacterium]|nr:glycosyltransferase family 4 protein [Tepidisphaeraceae bacterium]
MKTIAYIAGQFPKQSETFVWREVRELRRRGWTVHTFGLHAPNEETPPSLIDLREETTVIYERFGKPTNLFALAQGLHEGLGSSETELSDRLKLAIQSGIGAKLAREIRDRKVEHIHAHFAHAPTSVAMYAAQFAKVPFSFTGHANDLFQRRQALELKLTRATFVACISEWHRELYRSIVPRGDVAYPVIRCGVDTNSWTPKSSHGSEGSLKLITVGRLVEKKGIDLLVEEVAQLLKSGRRISLTIAGDGPQRAQLESIILREGASDSIKLLGSTDSDCVRQLMLEHDAFALPCRV